MIVLHGGPTPNARKIAIALYEMGLEWRLEDVDILAGDQLTPEFLALNPNNKTPVIVDENGPSGRFVLWETGAILLYLAEKTGRFLPADPEQRAICWQWLMFQVSGVGPMFGQAAHFGFYAAERHPYAIERYTREVDRLLRVLDGQLAKTQWVAGEEYTIADMTMLPYLRRPVEEQADRYPNVARWGQAMLQRPAVRDGMAVGIARPETIEGGLDGFTDEHRSILWGERQHAAR
ncbi:glutathione S-transferase family protein [Sphingomonas sp. IC4-52]|uniref:glutathione S-transferase family protein n=1 Tax=Sphingomonas sp. IC4-52 TaxID=2887202 RepID=UPI001D112434|nr:glutathione S-transferase N-terminal domain-containing protein [Sphingomonas sp. IC4-52]MCC2981089.1 glutathione S-transferase N-terminal domain-containing protein [Sphingomonas sp. IC4-52]